MRSKHGQFSAIAPKRRRLAAKAIRPLLKVLDQFDPYYTLPGRRRDNPQSLVARVEPPAEAPQTAREPEPRVAEFPTTWPAAASNAMEAVAKIFFGFDPPQAFDEERMREAKGRKRLSQEAESSILRGRLQDDLPPAVSKTNRTNDISDLELRSDLFSIFPYIRQ